MWFDYLEQYPIAPRLRRFYTPGIEVRHQQTCPECGRELVNLYLQNCKWKCKKCCEKEATHA